MKRTVRTTVNMKMKRQDSSLLDSIVDNKKVICTYKSILYCKDKLKYIMNPEKATDYLSRVNWKSLVEWLTAEAILNRPTDPIQFCRNLLGEKLSDRTSDDFKPDLITDWLRNCYTEATALVNEHGIIQNKTLHTTSQSLPEQLIELRRKVDGMQQLLDASSAIATLDPIQATENIVTETCRILKCDRATIFIVDNITKELVLTVAEGAKNIRVPIGQVMILF